MKYSYYEAMQSLVIVFYLFSIYHVKTWNWKPYYVTFIIVPAL